MELYLDIYETADKGIASNVVLDDQTVLEIQKKVKDAGYPIATMVTYSNMENYESVVTNRAYEVTGLENPNSVSQLKGWLSERGVEIDSLSKGAVAELIEDADGEVLEALKLRLLMAKTSVKKYEAIERSVCSDGRVHGLLQFYGANRTGRWAGRLVQVQNLPQNHISDLELARSLVRRGQFEELELFYESTPNVLSELIRTAFIPKEGCRFIVADFSAIEARVLAWLSGEQWRLDVFATHGKIYEAYRFEAAWKNPQRNRKYARYKNVHYPCGGCVPLFRYDVV